MRLIVAIIMISVLAGCTTVQVRNPNPNAEYKYSNYGDNARP